MQAHGPQIKLDRARQHLQALDRRVEEFITANPYTVTVSPNPRPPHYVVLADGYVEPDLDLGAIIGDFAHNARSALDLTIASLSSLTPDDRARFRLQFPVFDVETAPKQLPSYRGREATYLNGVGPRERGIIEQVQPYQLGGGLRRGATRHPCEHQRR